VDAVLRALAVLRDEGFAIVSLSGGEPFLYRQLATLVDGAVGLGYGINVVTNATVLTGRRVSDVARHLSFVAVSLDGARARHDRIRLRDGAFDDALRGIEVLRAAQVPFGLTCCVTADNLVDVPELYGIAVETGARLLNLRPLALVGRGSELGDVAALGPADLARLTLIADLLDGDPESEVAVRVDLAAAGELRAQAADAHSILLDEAGSLPLSDTVNPLILDDRGRLLPFAYGIHPRFAVAEGLDRMAERIATWKDEGVRGLRDLLERAVEALPEAPDEPVDWFDHLTRTSHTSYTAARLAHRA
jgi:Fe-coproporphyrin III synthase